MRNISFLSLLLIAILVGCATTGQFIRLELGMSKAQVIETIGEPDIARGSIHNKYDQVIDVWEYERFVSNWSPERKRMWVYFCDGHLAQWGEAGDWGQEADRIYEIRYR